MTEIPTISELLSWLSIMLGTSILLGSLLKKVNIPTVVGFVLIGMTIGPYGFGFITNLTLINLFADLGMVILLFTIGLGFSFEKLRSMGNTIFVITLVEFFIMLLLGFSVALLFDWGLVESLYIGGILAASSTAIILKLLHEAGILHTKEGNTIIGILIIEDLLTILIIASLAGLSSGKIDPFEIIFIIAKIIAFFVISLVIGLKIIPKLINHIDRLGIDEAPFVIALVLGFGLAFFANYLGLSVAIGAFLMGMIISSSPKSESITHKILPLKDFFSTIFFISIGMIINISLFSQYIIASLPLIAIAIIGKFIGNYISAIMVGYNRVSASTISVMMIPRGEFSFIIAKQGIDLGVKQSLLPLTMIITLSTMLIIPLLLRILPTIMDPRTIFSSKIFATLEFIGSLFGKLFKHKSEIMKHVLPRIFANIAILITIIAIFPLLEELLQLFYNTFTVFQILSYDIFKLAIILSMFTYPIFNIFVKTGEVTESIFKTFQHRIVNVRMIDNASYIYRIIRNIVSATTILIVSSVVIPFIEITTHIQNIFIISSLIILSMIVYLFLDTLFIVYKRLEKGIISSFGDDKNK